MEQDKDQDIVEVHYSFSVLNSYSGTVKMDKDDFKEMEKLGDGELCEMLGDYVDLCDPTDWSHDSVDVFEVRP